MTKLADQAAHRPRKSSDQRTRYLGFGLVLIGSALFLSAHITKQDQKPKQLVYGSPGIMGQVELIAAGDVLGVINLPTILPTTPVQPWQNVLPTLPAETQAAVPFQTISPTPSPRMTITPTLTPVATPTVLPSQPQITLVLKSAAASVTPTFTPTPTVAKIICGGVDFISSNKVLQEQCDQVSHVTEVLMTLTNDATDLVWDDLVNPDRSILSLEVLQNFSPDQIKDALKIGIASGGRVMNCQFDALPTQVGNDWLEQELHVTTENGVVRSYTMVLHLEGGRWRLFGTIENPL